MLNLTEDIREFPEIAAQLERAFAIAGNIFPYWRVELAALTPVIVNHPADDPKYAGFTFAVTEGMLLLISAHVLRAGWTKQAWATILVHELLHVWQRHPARRAAGEYPPGEWNIWADMEINDDLREAGCVFPTDPETGRVQGVFPEDMGFPLHLTAEEYAALAKQKQEQQYQKGIGPKQPAPQLGGGCGSGSGGENGVEAELKAAGLLRDRDAPPAPGDEPGEAPGEAEGSVSGRGAEEVEALIGRMDAGLIAASEGKEAGKVPSGLALLAEKRKRKSEIRWQDHLRAAVRKAVQFSRAGGYADWGRLSRRQYGAFLQPATRNPKVKVMVALDTSGSMLDLLGAAVTEIEGLLQAVRAEVQWVQADCEIAAAGKFRGAGDVKKLQLRGGGGTDFRPVFKHALAMRPTHRPDVLVYITDGYGSAPQNPPPFKTIWAMLGGTRPPAKWGEKVQIKA